MHLSSLDRLISRSPILFAVLVTLLWSSSFVLIKVGLREITPMLFASLRYLVASAILLVWVLASGTAEFSGLSRRDWLLLIALGVSGYTVAQGLQFVGLAFITAISTTFVLNLTPIAVALLGYPLLREGPRLRQWGGIAIALLGAYVYFGRPPEGNEAIGLAVVGVANVAWAFYLVLVRKSSKNPVLPSLAFTGTTMTIGSLLMFLIAITVEGWRTPSLSVMGMVVWMAAVNTAGAFLIWNMVLRHVRAYELSMLQNTMLIQIAVLALLFLGEGITLRMLFGMALVTIGVAVVQIRGASSHE